MNITIWLNYRQKNKHKLISYFAKTEEFSVHVHCVLWQKLKVSIFLWIIFIRIKLRNQRVFIFMYVLIHVWLLYVSICTRITKYNHAFLKERMISLLHIFLILVMHKTKVTSYEYMCLKIDIFTPRHDNVTNTQWNTSATKTHMTSLNGFQTKTSGITWLNLSKSYRILTYQTAWLL